MRLTDRNWRPLLWPGVTAATAAVVLAATAYGAQLWVTRHQEAFDRARVELEQSASQFRSASDDQAVYEQYAARFREVGEHGWIGPEHRLTWIEALQQVNDGRGLPQLRYDIARQQRVELPHEGGDHARLELYGTPMEVELEAPHEGDVLTLLRGLASRGKGLMALRGCRMERARDGNPIQLKATSANVRAQCTLNWYALQIEPQGGDDS
jgi:hypothetical protein